MVVSLKGGSIQNLRAEPTDQMRADARAEAGEELSRQGLDFYGPNQEDVLRSRGPSEGSLVQQLQERGLSTKGSYCELVTRWRRPCAARAPPFRLCLPVSPGGMNRHFNAIALERIVQQREEAREAGGEGEAVQTVLLKVLRNQCPMKAP